MNTAHPSSQFRRLNIRWVGESSISEGWGNVGGLAISLLWVIRYDMHIFFFFFLFFFLFPSERLTRIMHGLNDVYVNGGHYCNNPGEITYNY